MADNNTGTDAARQTQFSLGKVYLKDVSLEAPNSAEAFLAGEDWNPKVNLEYKIDTRDLSNDTHEVALTLTITAADGQKTIFLIQIQQGAIFLIRGIDNPEQLDRILNVRCPQVLFPYAREAVDNLVVKAGFPPLMLGPISFGAAHRGRVAEPSESGALLEEGLGS
jgi:preprotein translocase subunit SecB